jgi:O-antigen ligase
MSVSAARYRIARRERDSSVRLADIAVIVLAPSVGVLLWILLWTGINTGPWNLDLDYIESGIAGFFNGARAALPLLVLALLPIHLVVVQRRSVRRITTPEGLWIFYGIVCMASSVYASPWFDTAYWGLAWLATFAGTEIYMQEGQDPLIRAITLNRLNWLLSSIVLIVVLLVARGSLLSETSMGVSGYGVLNRLPSVAGMPMVRATGIARLAAVPALIAFVWLWNTSGFYRLIWGGIFLTSVSLMWVMQSRGATASLLAALCFMMVLHKGRARQIGLLIILLMGSVCLLGYVSNDSVHHLYLYATRGAEGHELRSMSGRDRIFSQAWQAIRNAPFIGYGPQADRQLPQIGNAQNAALYALLCGGFIGGLSYLAGLLLAWVMLIRVIRNRGKLKPVEQITLLQAAGILAFFTLRSYPENAAALYSVDLLLLLPAIVFIAEADRRLREAIPVRLQRVIRSSPETVISPAAPFSRHR